MPGGGARFWFTIPAGVAHLAPDEIDTWQPGGSEVVAGQRAPDAQGARDGGSEDDEPRPDASILVVEDHDDMRAYLAEGLAVIGPVARAADGRAALAAAREMHPRVIVTDII